MQEYNYLCDIIKCFIVLIENGVNTYTVEKWGKDPDDIMNQIKLSKKEQILQIRRVH